MAVHLSRFRYCHGQPTSLSGRRIRIAGPDHRHGDAVLYDQRIGRTGLYDAGDADKLHVLADTLGTFEGKNTQFNGVGFTKQKFDAVAMTLEAFTEWVAKVRSDGVALDAQTYGLLGASSTGAQVYETIGTSEMPASVVYFNQVTPDLFKK